MERILLLLMVVLLFLVPGVWAEEIELKIIKMGANLYEVPADDLFIQTEYCFEDAATAVLLLDETANKLIFAETNQQCDIRMVYGRSKIEAGEYQLKVTRDDDNWYRLVDQDVALKTAGCLSLVDNIEAQLTMNDDGTGTLSIPGVDETCQVEGVYAKAELRVEESSNK